MPSPSTKLKNKPAQKPAESSVKKHLISLFAISASVFVGCMYWQATLPTETSTIQPVSDYQSALNGSALTDIKRVGFSRRWLTQDTTTQMLNNMSEDNLTGYLNNMIPHERLFALIDKRTFAQNALRTLYHKNPLPTPDSPLPAPTDTQNRISIGLTTQYAATDADTRRINIEDKLYAHLLTPDPKVHDGKVFVSWIHRESGEVLLFNMMYISAKNRKNWVSIKPSSGWQTGGYDVNIYRFSNELEPIAQHTFFIDRVISQSIDDDDEWDLDELLDHDPDKSTPDDDVPLDITPAQDTHYIHEMFEI